MNKKEISSNELKELLNKLEVKNLNSGVNILDDENKNILEFINANGNYEYIIDENNMLARKSDEIKHNKNLDVKADTFLDFQLTENLKSKEKVLITFSQEELEEDLEVIKSEDIRIVLLNKKSYTVEERFVEVSDPHDKEIKITRDMLYNEELTDRFMKALFDLESIPMPTSSKATPAIMAQNQTVYHGPASNQYATVGSVDKGETVYILSIAYGYYHIQYYVTGTSQEKQGYVPALSIEDYSGPTPQEEDYYGGYCYASTELDVRTCDEFEKTAPVGTLFAHEGCTMIFHYEMPDKHVAYIEYSTSSGTKRGYVYNQYLIFPVETCVGVIKQRSDVYAGPNSNYASIGAVGGTEFVSIIAKEDNDIYIEYNTTGGRKRGYIKYDQLTPYHRPDVFPDFYTNGIDSYVVDERVIVYGGPNTNYAELGAVRNEDVVCFNTNNSNPQNYGFDFTCIEYTVTTTGQRKRGYVPASKIINGNLPEENNPIESFGTFTHFGSKIVYGQTQKGRDMFYYKCGTGPNHIFLTFALHGWEDGTKSDGSDYHGDGNMLLKVAKRFMQNFSNLSSSRLDSIKNKWTIFVFPGINLDGIVNGNSNNGFGRCLYNKLDPNRNWGGNFVPNNTSPRYRTGSSYFEAKELVNLRDCLRNNIGSGKNILLDVHGWYNQTVGNANLGRYYWNSMGIPSSRHSYGYGQGYLIAWAKNSSNLSATSSDYPGLGADSCLIELTPTTDYSDSNMNSYGDKFFNGTINILENYPATPVLPPTPSQKNSAFITALEKLTSAAQEYCPIAFLDRTPYNRNRLILQYLREPAYNGLMWTATTEAIDYRWISFAESKTGIKVGELSIYEDIIQKEILVQHLAIVAETAMIRDYSSSSDRPYILLASLMGDLLQLGGSVQKVYNNKNRVLSVSEIQRLIRCTDDSFAQELGFKDCGDPGLGWLDWYQDIDGLNIGIQCKTDDLLSVIKEYYTGYTNDSRLNRYGMYAQNLNLSDPYTAGTSTDLFRLAYSYTSGNVKLEDFFDINVVNLFKAVFGSFNSAMWATPLANALVDEFVNRMLKVGGNY